MFFLLNFFHAQLNSYPLAKYKSLEISLETEGIKFDDLFNLTIYDGTFEASDYFFLTTNCKCLEWIHICEEVNGNFSVNLELSNYPSLEHLYLGSGHILGTAAFYFCPNLKEFYANDCVQLAKWCFYRLEHLENVSCPNLETTGPYSFGGCNHLLYLQLPKLTFVPEYCFINSSIADVVLPEVQSIEYASFVLSNIRSLSAPKLVTIKVGPFIECYELVSVYAPSLTTIGQQSFYCCKNLMILDMPSLELIYEMAFDQCISLTSIDFPNVKYIAAQTFSSCISLVNVSVPNLVDLGSRAFQYCIKLKSIELLAVSKIGYGSFLGCSLLEKISIPLIQELPHSIFYDCSSLQTVDTPNVNEIYQYAFVNCHLIQDLSSLSNVTYIRKGAFINCSSIAEIDFPNLISIDIKSFKYCSSLHNINLRYITEIPESCFEGCSSVVSINCSLCWRIGPMAFKDCYSLCNITLSNECNELSDYCFSSCASLRQVIFESLHFLGEGTFFNCTGLKILEFDSIETIPSKCFMCCSNLEQILVPNLRALGESAFELCTSLTDIMLSFTSYIPNRAFCDCTSLKHVDMAAIVTNVGDFALARTNLSLFRYRVDGPVGDYAFAETPLETINLRSSYVGNFAFCQCTFLKNVTIALPSSNNVQVGGNNIFDGCVSLLFVDAKFTKLGNYVYKDCVSLVKPALAQNQDVSEGQFEGCLSFNNFTLNCVTLLGKTFRRSSISSIHLPNCVSIGKEDFAESNISFIDAPKLVSIGSRCFANCPMLREISLPNLEEANFNAFICSSNLVSVSFPLLKVLCSQVFASTGLAEVFFPNVINVNQQAFSSCHNLTKVDLPQVVEIGNKAFENCYNLSKILVPSLQTLSQFVFINCWSLQSVNFTNVRSIGDYTFANATNLTEIYLPYMTELNGNLFSGCISLKKASFPLVHWMYKDEHFLNCESLEEISLPSLRMVDEESQLSFSGCFKLSVLELGSTPPSTFNNASFVNLTMLKLKLPKKSDYEVYDKDVTVNGDVADDGYWCGISLPVQKKNDNTKMIIGISVGLGIILIVVMFILMFVLYRRKSMEKKLEQYQYKEAIEISIIKDFG